MSAYLESAAALLNRALEGYEEYHSGGLASSKKALADKRVEVAAEFAKLAAIERGLIPAEWVGDIVRAAGEAQEGRT